ncbi:MAG: 2-succinyl-5-enolpyruvyl-6-hydroxy-3-cyclohexene-1-carboxylic-acid synthase [Flavobacteriales bacterium]
MNEKIGIHELAALCAANGIRRAVLCPGSRCAPLTLAFTANPEIELFQVVDERSAAFFALGLSMASAAPVALICTSGSAVLNFAPALAEAYYADIPLVAITADRPAWKIGHQDGQAIRQPGVFDNYTKKSIAVNGDFASPEEASAALEEIQQVMQQAVSAPVGPVHINIAFDEPLYALAAPFVPLPEKTESPAPATLSGLEKEEIQALLAQKSRILIAAGQWDHSPVLWQALEAFASRHAAVIVTESLSNLPKEAALVYNANELLRVVSADVRAQMEPQLLISFGKGMVSRVLRRYLSGIADLHHVHVDAGAREIDTYGKFKAVYAMAPELFFRGLTREGQAENENFRQLWLENAAQAEQKAAQLLEKIPYSDLLAYRMVCRGLPSGISLHVANSMAVRYVNLLQKELPADIRIFCNRGVSGIDGSTSTAVGFAACRPDEDVWLLSGDLAFQYDSNALWNMHVSKRLRMVVFNNTGGGIFRVIEGPSQQPGKLNYFEAPVPSSAEPLALRSGAAYYAVQDAAGIAAGMEFLRTHSGGAAILEIFTPAKENEDVFKHFIQKLSEQI